MCVSIHKCTHTYTQIYTHMHVQLPLSVPTPGTQEEQRQDKVLNRFSRAIRIMKGLEGLERHLEGIQSSNQNKSMLLCVPERGDPEDNAWKWSQSGRRHTSKVIAAFC